MEKKTDFKASNIDVKKEERPNRVTLADVAHAQQPHALHQLAGRAPSWRLSHRQVPISPVPPHNLERTMEIRRRRKYLPADLHADPAYAVDYDQWLNWHRIKTNPRWKEEFLGDTDYPLGPPPPLPHPAAPCRAGPPSPPAPPQDNATLAFYNEEAKDDSDDFVGIVFHDSQTVMEEG
jgi:hypothetical protein